MSGSDQSPPPKPTRGDLRLSELGGGKLERGTRLGPFVIEGLLGAGGAGYVYRAIQPVLERRAAIKIIPGSFFDNDPAEDCFLEATALAKIDHGSVVKVYDARAEVDFVWMAMELVEGWPLRSTLLLPEPRSFATSWAIAQQITAGLNAAHQAGVIHRDLKPENIIMTQQNRVVVVDFGIAKVLARVQPNVEQITGTPAYMSPEHLMGKPVDHHTDLYALGVVLFELFAGRHIWSKSSSPLDLPERPELLRNQLFALPPLLSQVTDTVPEALSVLVASLLEKSPAHRPSSAEEVLARLNRLRPQDARLVQLFTEPVHLISDPLDGTDNTLRLGHQEIQSGNQDAPAGAAEGTEKEPLNSVLPDSRIDNAERGTAPSPVPRSGRFPTVGIVGSWVTPVSSSRPLEQGPKRSANHHREGRGNTLRMIEPPEAHNHGPKRRTEGKGNTLKLIDGAGSSRASVANALDGFASTASSASASPATPASNSAVAPTPDPGPTPASASRLVARPVTALRVVSGTSHLASERSRPVRSYPTRSRHRPASSSYPDPVAIDQPVGAPAPREGLPSPLVTYGSISLPPRAVSLRRRPPDANAGQSELLRSRFSTAALLYVSLVPTTLLAILVLLALRERTSDPKPAAVHYETPQPAPFLGSGHAGALEQQEVIGDAATPPSTASSMPGKPQRQVPSRSSDHLREPHLVHPYGQPPVDARR